MTREMVELIQDGRKFRRRRGKWERFWLAVATRLLLSFLDGWLFMLAVGIMHIHWLPGMPTISYWPAVVVALLLTAVFGVPKIPKPSDRKEVTPWPTNLSSTAGSSSS